MGQPSLDQVTAELKGIARVRPVGRVAIVSAGCLVVTGLGGHATIGDRVRLLPASGAPATGEIVAVSGDEATVLSDGALQGLGANDRVVLLGPDHISPDDGWMGRVIDPDGKPLDGRPILRGLTPRQVIGPPPPATERRPLGVRVPTGLAVFDTLLPIVRGQRIGLFAGSGVGKSTLLAGLAQGVAADVVVIALVGERGREVRHFIDRVLGPRGMERAVVVAGTSDRSALERRRTMLTAMCVAEHFRDAGRHVLLLADSVTRFAEAHREVALASGEAASLSGHPPSTPHLIAGLAERAGPGTDVQGDITAIFSVLVPGSDMEEPVADMLRGVLDGHVVLDRAIAERGRFPAVDVLRSVSRALPDAATPEENAMISLARRRLGAYARSEVMIRAGLYQPGTDPDLDAAVEVWPALDGFVGQSADAGIAASFEALAECLAGKGQVEVSAEDG
ncbi:MAG: FliI/YscN family ATPase [Paracoccaceae bacterium]|nr:FliI/YscN family ATPase [Paracoccaceae bacterium]